MTAPNGSGSTERVPDAELEIDFGPITLDRPLSNLTWDVMLRVVARIRIARGAVELLSEESFPVVELAVETAGWPTVLSARASDELVFASMEAEDAVMVAKRGSDGLWELSSPFAGHTRVICVSADELARALTSFAARVRAEVERAAGLDIAPLIERSGPARRVSR